MHAEIPRLAGKTTIFSEHEVQNYQFPENIYVRYAIIRIIIFISKSCAIQAI
jgi:hypothetical protein